MSREKLVPCHKVARYFELYDQTDPYASNLSDEAYEQASEERIELFDELGLASLSYDELEQLGIDHQRGKN